MTSQILQRGAVIRIFLVVVGLGVLLLAPLPFIVHAGLKDTERTAIEDVVRIIGSRYGQQGETWKKIGSVLGDAKQVAGVLIMDKNRNVLHAADNHPIAADMPSPGEGVYLSSSSGLAVLDIYWPRPGIMLDKDLAIRLDVRRLRNEVIGFTLATLALLVLFSFFVTLMIVLAVRARPVPPIQHPVPTKNAGERRRDLEREVAERTQALKESEERFLHFARSASDWFWEMDSGLRFIWFSDRFTEITGVEQSVLLGKTRRETGIPGLQEEYWQTHLRILDAHEPFRNFVHPRVKPDGSIVHVAISGVPVHDDQGNFTGYRGIGSDITSYYEHDQALQAERDRAEKASRAKSEFLSAMSHELRTPLNAILGVGQIMQLVDPENLTETQQDQLALIVKNGEHLLELVENVLVLGDILGGDKDMDLVAVEAGPVIARVLETAAFIADEKGVVLVNDAANNDFPAIRGDRDRIGQVLLGLVSNGIKYNDEGGTVSINAHVTGDNRLRISVTDTGRGIPADKQRDLFQPFARLGHENGVILGAGIGLTISRKLIELMQGQIGFESEAGKGSAFWFDLPLAQDE